MMLTAKVVLLQPKFLHYYFFVLFLKIYLFDLNDMYVTNIKGDVETIVFSSYYLMNVRRNDVLNKTRKKLSNFKFRLLLYPVSNSIKMSLYFVSVSTYVCL